MKDIIIGVIAGLLMFGIPAVVYVLRTGELIVTGKQIGRAHV